MTFCRASTAYQALIPRTLVLVITRFGQKREALYFPYTKERRTLLRRIATFANARDLKRRLGRSSK